jgi:hypothetical protein
VASTNGRTATLESSFEYPASGGEFLSNPTPESAWSKEPWAYDKAYLVFIMKDENVEQNNQWVDDQLRGERRTPPPGELSFTPSEYLTVIVNGTPKTLLPFKTLRVQVQGKARCFFVSLAGETKVGASNQVSVTLPVERGLVFSGAYLDLPDQMPYGR